MAPKYEISGNRDNQPLILKRNRFFSNNSCTKEKVPSTSRLQSIYGDKKVSNESLHSGQTGGR